MSIGIPGSGKSTWWEMGVKSGVIPLNALRINMDSIRKELTGNESDQSKNDLVAKVAMSTLYGALANEIEVIYWDNTSVKRRFRKDVIIAAKKANYDVIGIWFDVDLNLAKSRNAARSRKVPDDIIDNMYATLNNQKPDIAEGFTQIIVVN